MLLASGDSFTWGNELPDCDESRCSRFSWSALLAEQMGVGYDCVAEGGASNQTIASKIMRRLTEIPIPKLVAVMWTFPVRHELLLRRDHSLRLHKPYINVSPWHAAEEKDPLLRSYAESMISLAAHEYHEQQTLISMYALTSLLQSTGVDFVFSAATTQVYDLLEKDSIMSRQLRSRRWHRYGEGFYDWSRAKGFEMSALGHPVSAAHVEWIEGYAI